MSRQMHLNACFFALALVAASAPAAAKPLYITVNRSFGTDENPVVDVAFQNRGPVELRVLKPKDLESYLKAQANLRRVWDEPNTTHNPGRALSKGLNASRGPGQFLLFALDPELRSHLAPALGAREEKDGTATLRVAEGPKKLVGVPDGLEQVRAQWLNLDLGGGQRGFDVPGFDDWSGDSAFEERRVSLPLLPAGIYVVQLVQGNVDGQVVLVVSDLTVQVKQTDGKVLVRAANRGQAPVKGATVSVRGPSGAPLLATTDGNGEAILNTAEPRLLVTVQNGGDTALVDTEFFSTLMTTPDVFLYTDRPIYHPGDEVQFRGVVRKPESYLARLFLPTKRSVTVEVRTDDGGGAKTTVNVDAFGSFAGKLRAPEDAVVGVLRVTATVDGRPYQGEARVQDYVKPTFFVELAPESEAIVPGKKLKARLRAERYAGGAPTAGFEVMLTRSSMDTPAWVDDAGKGGQGSAVTYGSAATTEGKLSVPDRVYSSLAERLDKGEAEASDTWASAPTFDAQGNAEIEVEVPALKEGEERIPWRYALNVRARDDQGTFASSTATLYLSPYDVLGALRVNPKVVKVGGSAALSVRSTTLSGKAAPKVPGSVRFVLRSKSGAESEPGAAQSFTTDDEGRATVPFPTSQPGAWVARVTLTDKKGAAWNGEDRLIVVGNAGEAVEWVPELTLLSPTTTLSASERVDVVALLPDEWGPGGKNEGPLWLTLSGNDLYETRLLSAKGNTVVVPVGAEKRFGSAVYASLSYPTRSGRWEERTAPFRIVPKERVLT
ncbi:MAG: alpha-2-macroglobulin, partial [Deltaproteobacteria bacterium]|nr:alpha-2-macroglobulin [Deltaproteobacteria bacterium]